MTKPILSNLLKLVRNTTFIILENPFFTHLFLRKGIYHILRTFLLPLNPVLRPLSDLGLFIRLSDSVLRVPVNEYNFFLRNQETRTYTETFTSNSDTGSLSNVYSFLW